MGKLKNKFIISFFIIFFLVGTLMIISSAAVLGNEHSEDLATEKSEKLMEAILADYQSILSSTPNVTPATQLLAALPERKDKPAVAVYSIADKTGQIKEEGSAVVTQGATDMMITALKRSRQFKVLDRVNFGDFMNEQNLKTNDRLAGNEGPGIGELTGADYLIQGAITEYQVDRKSGGLGLSIGGLGGTTEYAVATTAVDIRVLNTTSGEVVWAESLKGEIEGKRVGVQAFSFMGNNIVEFETGRGKQEVINLIVRTLLEEAVFKIYQQGVI
ncbi:MAG: CsgG/HfaB family protein [Halanaerobiales bacterium]|nr:CsgG/HfaB family protein [Halanaerobiales bacterium]